MREERFFHMIFLIWGVILGHWLWPWGVVGAVACQAVLVLIGEGAGES